MNSAPLPDPRPFTRVDQPCVWGGFIDRHFGHFIADHLPRLLVSLLERPNDLYLFTTEPEVGEADLPAHIWDLLAWYGLPRGQLRIVSQPLIAAELRVAPQEETRPDVAPSPQYLDLVEARCRANELRPEPSDLLYVNRLGMVSSGAGGHAGEAYLVAILTKLGIPVLNPATAPLREQLARYAGARRIVFAEGSALHGRQLLGRLPKEIHVLRCRPGICMVRELIAPRCTKILYHDTVSERLMAYYPNGKKRPDPAISLYDLDGLFAAFSMLGIELGPLWEGDAYRAAVITDVENWIKARKVPFDQAAGHIYRLELAGLLPADYTGAALIAAASQI